MSGVELAGAALTVYGYVKAAGNASEGNYGAAAVSAFGGDVVNHVKDGVGTAMDAAGAASDYGEYRHPTKADGSRDMRYTRNQ